MLLLVVPLAEGLSLRHGALDLDEGLEGPSASQEMEMTFQRNLWAGFDVIDDVAFMEQSAQLDAELEAESSKASETSSAAKKKRGVQILGLQDTGTNLLYSMLRQNFVGQLTYYTGAGKSWSDRGIWKHANVWAKFSNEPEKFKPIQDGNVVAIAMVREPLSWLQSIQKAPYELKKCTWGDDWLSRPCEHPLPAGYPDIEPEDAPEGVQALRRVVPPQQYSSLGEVWNQWTVNYENLTAAGFADGIVISYEDLVLHPKKVMRRIASRLGFEELQNIAIKETAAKTHGSSLCRQEAIGKIFTRTYLPLFKNGQRWAACTALSKDVMHKYGYRDCDCCRAV